MMPLFDLRQLPARFYTDPYPDYAHLQAHTPILECADGSYLLTRYADLWQIYRDARHFSSDKTAQFAPRFGAGTPLYEHHTSSLVFNDPPLHTRVRKAIGNALSQQMVRVLQQDLTRLVDDLLARLADRQEVDLIADYAAAIPIEIIGNMLGVPPAERAPLRRWSLAILGALEVDLDDEGLQRGHACVSEFLDFLADFVPRRRARLRAHDDDILARLLRWMDAQGGLTPTELYHQCIFLLNAGHETTTNLIGNGVELLLRFSDARAALLAQPTLIDSAVEEILRFESPNQLGNRTTTQAVQVGDVRLPAGVHLTLCIGAANRDPAQFPHAQNFDITRSANAHLAFGAGIHTCAGLHVARLEGRIAILRLLQRYPGLALAAAPQRAARARFRGFSTLPVILA